jgi:predicted secreted protein
MTKEKNEEVKIEVGQVIDISLESMMGSTGYGWELAELTGSVYLIGITVVPSQNGSIGPVNQQFHFKGAKVGKAKITFVLTAAWKVEDPIKTLTYEIIVKEAEKPSEDDLKLEGFVAAPRANVSQPNQPVSIYAVWPPYGIPSDYWQRLYYGVLPPQNTSMPDPRLYYGVCCAPSANTADPRVYYGVCCPQDDNMADPRVYYGVCCAPSANIPDPRVYYGVCCAPDAASMGGNLAAEPNLLYGVRCATDFDQCGTPPQIYKYGILPRPLYGIPPVAKYNIPPMMRYNYPGINC